MANFEKSHLKYSYSWNKNGRVHASEKIHFHDTSLLDTEDGHEMLLFINSYMDLKNYAMLCTFHKIEEVIKKELAETKRGYNTIKRWLNENYFF